MPDYHKIHRLLGERELPVEKWGNFTSGLLNTKYPQTRCFIVHLVFPISTRSARPPWFIANFGMVSVRFIVPSKRENLRRTITLTVPGKGISKFDNIEHGVHTSSATPLIMSESIMEEQDPSLFLDEDDSKSGSSNVEKAAAEMEQSQAGTTVPPKADAQVQLTMIRIPSRTPWQSRKLSRCFVFVFWLS